MKGLHMTAFILLIVGGLNWLLVGVSGWEIGALFGGMGAAVSRLIYVLVGFAAIFELFTHKKGCMHCKKSASAPAGGTGQGQTM